MTGQVAFRSHFNTSGCGMTATIPSDETVSGTLDRTVDAGSVEFIGSGALLDFAQFLTVTACRRLIGEKAVGGLLQSSINIFGATPARVDLLRTSRSDPDYLKGKKLIIWCFSAREFSEAPAWQKVPVQ